MKKMIKASLVKKIREKTETFNFQNDWEFWVKSINKIIYDDKEKLTNKLEERVKDKKEVKNMSNDIYINYLREYYKSLKNK